MNPEREAWKRSQTPNGSLLDIFKKKAFKKMCGWQLLEQDNEMYYSTNCAHLIVATDDINNYLYCPYCGREIKWVKYE